MILTILAYVATTYVVSFLLFVILAALNTELFNMVQSLSDREVKILLAFCPLFALVTLLLLGLRTAFLYLTPRGRYILRLQRLQREKQLKDLEKQLREDS